MLAVMKQRSSNNVCPNDSDQEIKYEVAEILCHLPQLVLQSELLYLSNLSWGARKRRSPNGVTRSWSSASPSPSPPPPQPPPPPPPPCKNGQVVPISIVSIVKDTSPDTPLSFFPHCESDSSRKRRKRKVSKKMTREEWEEVLIKKSKQHETFKKELQKVMEHYRSLKAQNFKIKSIMQELNNLQEAEGLLNSNSSKKITTLDLFVEPAGPIAPSPAQEQPLVENLVSNVIYQRPELINQKPQFGSEIFENSYPYSQTPPPLPSGIGLAMAKHLGHFGIPDLNFTVDHDSTSSSITGIDLFQPFDPRKAAITAEARRRRRFEMNKVKKSMANAKTRLQIR